MLDLIKEVYFGVGANIDIEPGSIEDEEDFTSWKYDYVDQPLEVYSLKYEGFVDYLNLFLQISNDDELLYFFRNEGIYCIPGNVKNPLSDLLLPSEYLEMINLINELRDLLAFIESNKRDELRNRFHWGLEDATYTFINWPEKLDIGFEHLANSIRGVKGIDYKTMEKYKKDNKYSLPSWIEINDYKTAVNYIVQRVINLYIKPPQIFFIEEDDRFIIRPLIRHFKDFIWIVFADSLSKGSRFKICEACGKTFSVEVKPGREPSVCGGTCRARKFRRKNNERPS